MGAARPGAGMRRTRRGGFGGATLLCASRVSWPQAVLGVLVLPALPRGCAQPAASQGTGLRASSASCRAAGTIRAPQRQPCASSRLTPNFSPHPKIKDRGCRSRSLLLQQSAATCWAGTGTGLGWDGCATGSHRWQGWWHVALRASPLPAAQAVCEISGRSEIKLFLQKQPQSASFHKKWLQRQRVVMQRDANSPEALGWRREGTGELHAPSMRQRGTVC